jgi:hypothetical protein
LEITNRLSCVVYTRIAVNLAGSSGLRPRFRQPGDKPRPNPPSPCPGPPRLFPFCPQQRSPGAHPRASYPRQGPLRPEIRHQGCVVQPLLEERGETRTVDWGRAVIGGGVVCGYHLTVVISGRGLWTAGAKGLVRSAAQICSALRHGAKRQKIRHSRGRNDVDDDGLS